MSPTRLLPLLSLLCLGLAGCHRYPKTPEDALLRIEQVVVSADATAAWELVDHDTKNAVASAFANERLMRTIVRAKYPPAEAERELARLADAEQSDAAHFFVALMNRWGTLAGYRNRLGSVSGPVLTKPDGTDALYVTRKDGIPFHLAKVGGGWAWIDPRTDWQLEKDRAAHALQTISDNAALYKKSESP